MATALDSAGQRLANDAGELGISGLVSADRMETPEAVQATHRALLMFRPMLDRYRATQRALTRVYEDSVATLVRSGAWTRTDLDEWRVRDIPVEPARYVARGDSLVAALARLYELLQEQQGAVQVTAEWARFNESAAGDEYDSLRARIQRLMLTNRPGDQGSVSPTLLLLMAIAGDGSPPPRLSD
jgi:fructose-1-phosphate kinase PfkB-like protein